MCNSFGKNLNKGKKKGGEEKKKKEGLQNYYPCGQKTKTDILMVCFWLSGTENTDSTYRFV